MRPVRRAPREQQALLVSSVVASFQEAAATKYVLPFQFRSDVRGAARHHLVFLASGFEDYAGMKEVMARHGTAGGDTVASFEYIPGGLERRSVRSSADLRKDLAQELLDIYNGRTFTLGALYRDHSVPTPYVMGDYIGALRGLEDTGCIHVQRGIGSGERAYDGPTSITFAADRDHG